MAAQLDLSVENGLRIDQGETYRLVITYAIPGENEGDPDVPIDLTGCQARMQIREKYASPVLVELTTENEGIVLNGDTGVIQVAMTAEQTDTLGAKEGSSRPRETAAYDLEVVFPSGDVRRVVQGAVEISPNITRAAV